MQTESSESIKSGCYVAVLLHMVTNKSNATAKHTCHLAPIGHAHGTEAVVGHGGDLPSTARAVVVVTVGVWMGHGVGVIGVQVIAALWTLEQRGAEEVILHKPSR